MSARTLGSGAAACKIAEATDHVSTARDFLHAAFLAAGKIDGPDGEAVSAVLVALDASLRDALNALGSAK